MTPAIGGYFGLEQGSGSGLLHKDAIRLNSARNGFEYILTAKRYRRVHLPLFTCDAMFEGPRKLGVDIRFYRIGPDLEPAELPELGPDEAFVYTNYFGLKQSAVQRLHERYGDRLIVDNAQAFFAPALPGVDTIYSPRKFFGVPDGGYLYTDNKLAETLPQADSAGRFPYLVKRIECGAEAGYADFREAEKTLDLAPLQSMSRLTETLLEAIDYRRAARIRRENFRLLHDSLEGSNRIRPQMDGNAVPMVYPYCTADKGLRERLIRNRVYVATYWPNVLQSASPDSVEYRLSEGILPLPVDQRYGKEEMDRILELINAC